MSRRERTRTYYNGHLMKAITTEVWSAWLTVSSNTCDISFVVIIAPKLASWDQVWLINAISKRQKKSQVFSLFWIVSSPCIKTYCLVLVIIEIQIRYVSAHITFILAPFQTSTYSLKSYCSHCTIHDFERSNQTPS